MEPSITSEPNAKPIVSQGSTTDHLQIDTGNVGSPKLRRKRNSSILSAPSSPSSSSSKLHNDEDQLGTTGLREKRSSDGTSPKTSEEKHTDNYSVSAGNNSYDSVDKGGTINGHAKSNLTPVPSSSSSMSTPLSSLDPHIHLTAPLGVPIGRLTTSSLRGAQKDHDPSKPNKSSPDASHSRLPSLPMARGSPVRRFSGALNHSGKHGGLNMSGKTVSIKGSFNSAYGEPITPHVSRDKAGYAGLGNREHKRHGMMRYDRFWDGVHAMIDIQNSTKIQPEMTKKETKKHLNDFERMRELYLIHPNGRYKMIWDMIAGLAIFYSVRLTLWSSTTSFSQQ